MSNDPNGLLGDDSSTGSAKEKATTPPTQSSVAEKPPEPASSKDAASAGAGAKTGASDPQLPEKPQRVEPTGKLVPVRVLVRCVHGMPNDIAEIDETLVKVAERNGLVCSHKASVEFVKSLKR
ncbi:hypothetical protein AB4851_08710 [Burkholderia sp. 22PA0099]|uniref:hypothetical protein n=1 Tax=Burkholderia sp. 22PA0099 TaxID=3237372 RepID=UPI0039C487F5